MISYELLQQLMDWQSKGNRTVEIKIGDLGENEKISIWVYDFDLSSGQFIKNDISEIDLIGKKRKDLEKELAKLNDLERSK